MTDSNKCGTSFFAAMPTKPRSSQSIASVRAAIGRNRSLDGTHLQISHNANTDSAEKPLGVLRRRSEIEIVENNPFMLSLVEAFFGFSQNQYKGPIPPPSIGLTPRQRSDYKKYDKERSRDDE